MGFDDTFKSIWSKGRKIDPLSHRALEAIVKMDSKGVRETSRGLAKVTGGEGSWLGRRFGDLGDEADKNANDPVRGIGRAAASTGLVYGGMALAGSGGGAAAAGGAEAGTAETALGGAVAAGAPETAGTVGGLESAGGGLGAVEGTAGSAGPGEAQGIAQAGRGGFSPQFNRLMGMRQQQQPTALSQWHDVEVPRNEYIDDLMLSSKKAKKPVARNAEQAIQRGARRETVIDTVGVQTAAIKALVHRRDRIRAHMALTRSQR